MCEKCDQKENLADKQSRCEYAWWLPKGSIRALVFMGTLVFLGIFACMADGDSRSMIIGAFIVIAKTAADKYFERKDEPKS